MLTVFIKTSLLTTILAFASNAFAGKCRPSIFAPDEGIDHYGKLLRKIARTKLPFHPDFMDADLREFVGRLTKEGRVYLVPKVTGALGIGRLTAVDRFGNILIARGSERNPDLSASLLRSILVSHARPSSSNRPFFAYDRSMPDALLSASAVVDKLYPDRLIAFEDLDVLPFATALPQGMAYYPAAGYDIEHEFTIEAFFPTIERVLTTDILYDRDSPKYTERNGLQYIIAYQDLKAADPAPLQADEDISMVIFKCSNGLNCLMDSPNFLAMSLTTLQLEGVVLNYNDWGYHPILEFLPNEVLGLEKLPYIHTKSRQRIDVLSKVAHINNDRARRLLTLDRALFLVAVGIERGIYHLGYRFNKLGHTKAEKEFAAAVTREAELKDSALPYLKLLEYHLEAVDDLKIQREALGLLWQTMIELQKITKQADVLHATRKTINWIHTELRKLGIRHVVSFEEVLDWEGLE